MNNKNMDITDLIKKYEQVRYMNKKFYFDADEFAMITNHYNNKKDILEAERAVNLGLSMHPYNYNLMIIKAEMLIALDKYEIAYDHLLTIAQDDTNVNLLLLKFKCLIKLGRTVEASSYLDYILEGDLDEADYYTFVKEVGYLCNDAEYFDSSTMLLEKALKVDPTNTDVLIELSYAYEMSDNIDKAIDLTNALIDLNPYSFDSWVTLGRLYLYNYEYDLSIDAYDFALAIKESDVDVLKLKAVTYSEGLDFEKELIVLNECIDASPDDLSLYDDLLEKYREFEEYWMEEKDEEILKVLEKKEARFGPKGLLLKMAHLNLRLDKLDIAKEIFTRIAEEDKNTVEYYKLEGNIAIFNDDYVAAEVAYMKALSESPTDVEVLDSLAEINLEMDKYEQSAEYLEQMIAVDPKAAIGTFRLAYIRFEIGEKEPFDRALSNISDTKELSILLGMFSPNRSKEKIDYDQFSRDELLIQLEEARKIRVELKNK